MISLKQLTVPAVHRPNRLLDAGHLGSRAHLPPRLACHLISDMTKEMLALAGHFGLLHRHTRRAVCHVRQISIYVCHVAMRLPYRDISLAFGLDRSTVFHACSVVERRRDDPDFDAFITTLERVAATVLKTSEGEYDV